MANQSIAAEVERLALASAFEGTEKGGWQFPFDFGDGLVARTYTEFQTKLNPWRRDILLANLDQIFGDKYAGLSVLDIGACEGSMSEGLWQRGVRDLTLLEGRAINTEKAKFVARVKGYDFKVIQADVLDYLKQESRSYDLVLCMATIHILSDPVGIAAQIARVAKYAVIDTPIARPRDLTMHNSHWLGAPEQAGFFLRRYHNTMTASFRSFELWPNRAALDLILTEAGFTTVTQASIQHDPFQFYSDGEWVMVIASH
jgi:2-polyprenyl-3-methyl-5-hydroxy-6-metoxy-1,4-benzoquinol methylase